MLEIPERLNYAEWDAVDFVGELYSAIVAGKYKKHFNNYENPLSESDRNSLIEQGIPNVFTNKII